MPLYSEFSIKSYIEKVYSKPGIGIQWDSFKSLSENTAKNHRHQASSRGIGQYVSMNYTGRFFLKQQTLFNTFHHQVKMVLVIP